MTKINGSQASIYHQLKQKYAAKCQLDLFSA